MVIKLKEDKNRRVAKRSWDMDRCFEEIDWRKAHLGKLDDDIQKYDGSRKTLHQYTAAVEEYNKIYAEVMEIQKHAAQLQLDYEAIQRRLDRYISTMPEPVNQRFNFMDIIGFAMISFVISFGYQVYHYHCLDMCIIYNTIIVFIIGIIIWILSISNNKKAIHQ